MDKALSLKDLIREVLDKGYLMSLATIDDAGPWVADVIYVHDNNLKVYWVSDPAVRHSQAIEKNPSVAATITASSAGESNFGIQLAGMATKLVGSRPDLAKKHWAKRKKPGPIPNDWLEGDRWYKIKPVKIELIHEKYFGFTKQPYKSSV
ncbi:MAG: pyridoxamine 5'-phosphate oxidase family protein [Patescibacteria group bacterium]